MTTFETRLDYSHRDVTSLPEEVVESYKSVTLLDVSNNQIMDVSFTGRFTNLNSLIMDHNLITSDVVFPVMPGLATLWLNFNKIDRLGLMIGNLKNSFPNLRHLSMMGNTASPPCTEDTFYDYVNYRLVVVSYLTRLEYLDDRPVSQDEKEEAERLYGEPEVPYALPASNISDVVSSWVDKVFSFIDPSPVTGSTGRSAFGHRASVI